MTPHPTHPVQMLPVLYRMTEEPPKPIVMEMSPRTWTEYQDSINSTNQARGTTCKISLCSRTRLHVTLRRCQTTKQPTARQAKHSASSSVIACQTTKASRSTASHQLGVRPPKRTILILFSQVRLKQRLRPPHKSGSASTNSTHTRGQGAARDPGQNACTVGGPTPPS